MNSEHLCDCTASDTCPLGRVGMVARCTTKERLAHLEAKVALLSSLLHKRSKKQRPETEGEVWVYMQTLNDGNRNLLKEDALWFWDKMEGSGWKNDGKAVASWKATISAWKRHGGIFPSQKQQNASNGQPGASVGTLQRVIEDKRAAAAGFKNTNSYQTALDTIWESPLKQQQYRRMLQEIKQLQAELSERLGLNHPKR